MNEKQREQRKEYYRKKALKHYFFVCNKYKINKPKK